MFGGRFYSLTKTDDEVSVICEEARVPNAVVAERDWRCFKIQGPLDFGLTGILASLAAPLADAEVSIFATSTYDTDYILVKADNLERAIDILTKLGHSIEQQVNAAPVDGPAIEFEPDPMVAKLLGLDTDPTFGLVVAAGWPLDPRAKQPYDKFKAALARCWEPEDVALSRVYLYPFESLHVTATSLYRIGDIPENEQAMITVAKRVVCRATEMKSWPTKPLQLQIDRAQIGIKAGILLWRDTTGGIDAIRQCLVTAGEELRCELESAGIPAEKWSTPGIIHTTVLRFHQKPVSDGATVQQHFQKSVLDQLPSLFPDPIAVPVAKLVCERTPYMHIPHNAGHVFATSLLAPAADTRYIEDCQQAEERLAAYQSSF